jgi:predicted TIM-barrel fold metal-dependent hydrolase
MINQDVFVVDAVAHALHFAPENQVDPESHPNLGDQEHRRVHQGFSPGPDSPYVLEKEQWLRGNDPELVAHTLFAESWTDFTVYHGVPQHGTWKDGGSPFDVGVEMRRRWPQRIALYGPLSPFRPDALEELELLVAEQGCLGVKFYPVDIVDGRVQSFYMNDHKLLYPIYARARELGVKSIAVHKAIPLGQFPTAPYRVEDVEECAIDFPDLTFEIVHGGAAFLPETVNLLRRFPNIIVNLEGTSALPHRAPRLFMEIIGSMLQGMPEGDRILWGTGATAVHPQPLLEFFWNLELPQDLIEGYGYRPLTDDIKRNILGLNALRILGLDVDELRRAQAGDEFDRDELSPPWSSPTLARA